jgi:hypothetical protein
MLKKIKEKEKKRGAIAGFSCYNVTPLPEN